MPHVLFQLEKSCGLVVAFAVPGIRAKTRELCLRDVLSQLLIDERLLKPSLRRLRDILAHGEK